MRKRSRMGAGESRSTFRKGAARVHPKNGQKSNGGSMRGGIRL